MLELNRKFFAKLIATSVALPLIAVVLAKPANAGVKFSLAGALNYGLKSYDLGAFGTLKGALGYGGGALMEFGSGRVTLQVGGIYIIRKFELLGMTSEFKAVHLPGMVMFGLGSKVALGLGGFYDISMETGGENVYGASGGLRFNFMVGSSTSFFIYPKFNYCLKETAGGQKDYELMTLVGLTFGAKK